MGKAITPGGDPFPSAADIGYPIQERTSSFNLILPLDSRDGNRLPEKQARYLSGSLSRHLNNYPLRSAGYGEIPCPPIAKGMFLTSNLQEYVKNMS